MTIFPVAAAGHVPYGSSKRTSSIGQIIFSFWSLVQRKCFENLELIIGLDCYFKQFVRLNWVPVLFILG